MAVAEVEDDDALTYDDEDAAAWYAAAAAAEGEGDEEEYEEAAEETEDGAAAEMLDPYQVVDDEVVAIDDDPYLAGTATVAAEADPYLAAAADPYLEGSLVQPPAAPTLVPEKRPAVTAAAMAVSAQGEPPRKAQKTQAQAQTSRPVAPPVASSAAALRAAAFKEVVPTAGAAVRPPPPAPPMPDLPAADGGVIGEDGAAPLAAPVEPPAFDGMPGEEIDVASGSAAALPEALAEPVPEMGTPAEGAAEGEADFEGEITWDERVVVVRQGQVHIELQHQIPPMRDEDLLRFCDWLDQQMPIVVENFPYVRKSGAHIDLSDNVIGPEGLDKLFRVLRDHRVPCTVIKAYRNLLNDTIVDTLIEYLYTQPESFPMHGIHISHNKVTDKGAFRLIRAAAQCGHYPRLTSRLPLWLRLECNDIQSPHQLVNDCLKEDFNVCLMKDGLCSRPTCNHYSGVHVQLPYFFHQHGKAPSQMRPAPQQPRAIPPVVAVAPPPHMAGVAPAGVEMQIPKADPDAASDPAPDWMRESQRPATLWTAAPKRLPAPAAGPSAPLAAEAALPQPSGPAAPKLLQPRRPAPPPSAAVPSVSPELAAILAPGAPVPLRPASPPPPPQLAPPVSEDFGYGQPQPQPPLPGGPKQSSVFRARSISSGTAEGRVPSSFGGRGNSYVDSAPQVAQPEFAQAGKGCWGGGGGGWGNKGNNGGWGGKAGGAGGWGGKGGGKGGGRDRGQMWQGLTLPQKVKKDVKLTEADVTLGFVWSFMGEGHSPQVVSVEAGSQVSEAAAPGLCLLRVNGLDTSMFSEKQIADMLKQRPLALRFGDQ